MEDKPGFVNLSQRSPEVSQFVRLFQPPDPVTQPRLVESGDLQGVLCGKKRSDKPCKANRWKFQEEDAGQYHFTCAECDGELILDPSKEVLYWIPSN